MIGTFTCLERQETNSSGGRIVLLQPSPLAIEEDQTLNYKGKLGSYQPVLPFWGQTWNETE